jgi:hypothetical protein
MEYMRSLFGHFCTDDAEVEVRCTLIFALFTGSHFIAARHPGRSREQVIDLALNKLLG